MIDKAWEGVTKKTLISSWQKLWPESVLASNPDHDFEGFDPDDPVLNIVNDIVTLGHDLGLEVDGSDVEELVQEHCEELTTDELLKLQAEQQQKVIEDLSSEEEGREDTPTLSSSEIKEILMMWEKVQSFVEHHHPNKAVSGRAGALFNDNAMSHFRGILLRKQKQVSLDKFLLKKRQQQSEDEPQPGPSGVKFPRREGTPKSEDSSSS